MQMLYFLLAALHMIAVVVTGILWTLIDLRRQSSLRPHLRDIRAVHFGSPYLVAWFLGFGLCVRQAGRSRLASGVVPGGAGGAGLLRWNRLPFASTTSAGPVLLLDSWLADGSILDRPGLPYSGPPLDGGGFGRLRIPQIG